MIYLLISSAIAYNQTLAKRLLGYATVAYESQNNIRFWNCSICPLFPLQEAAPVYNALYDVGGYVGFSQQLNAIIVAFHGTSDIRAFVLNIDFSMVNFPGCSGCQIDSMYSKFYDAVKGTIKSSLNSLLQRHNGAAIIVTGHAIGGALAGIFAVQLRTVNYPVNGVYTFGQTRVGNDKFSYYATASLMGKMFRIVHYADAVAHYPAMNMGFKHYAQEVFYSQDMRYSRLCDPINGEDNSCSNSVFVIYYNFDDNSLQAYNRMGM